MKTLLITAIAGDIAQSIAQIARETFPDWRLVGCDLHDRHGGSLLVDTCVVGPAAASPSYAAWLAALVADEGVDLCLPMSEAELRHFAQGHLRTAGTAALVMANPRAIEVGSDKLATARHLQSAGCPAPWTLPADEPQAAAKFPCIFKPRRGAGSKGVFICQSQADARFFAARFPQAVLQELLLPDDREVTCAIYRTKQGAIAILQLLRKLVGGFTGWAQVIDDAEVRRQCTSLAESLDLCGSINVQLRLTAAGPRIFEINPRFSSTVLMRHRMGYQDVVWALREALGEAVAPRIPAVGLTAVRTQGAALLGEA